MKRLSMKMTAAGILTLLCGASLASRAQTFGTTSLVSDGFVPASVIDPNLINPWGISFSQGSPFWISDNNAGVSTLYSVNPVTNAASIVPLVVSIPPGGGTGTPTGQVFNGTPEFRNGHPKSDVFLFVSEDGTVSGWQGALGTSAETLQVASAANVYKGSALAVVGGHTYLYAANFRTGNIDVIKGAAGDPTLTGTFTDPGIPNGYAPFNIQNLNGKLYVTYALQNGAKHDDVAGAGHGFVDAYDLNGNFLGRVGSGGALDSPWGLAIAPGSFGAFAGDLLVGNFGDGTINAFNLTSDSFVGQLKDINNNPIAIDGLWGLAVGNNGGAGSSNRLYFTAGTDGEQHGLFGSVQSVPEMGGMAQFFIVGLTSAGVLLRRKKSGKTRNGKGA